MPTTSTETTTGTPSAPPPGGRAAVRRPLLWVLVAVAVALVAAGAAAVLLGGSDGDDAPPPFDEALRGAAGGVTVPAGADVQEIVDGHPAGTTFTLEPGVYTAQQITPRDGDVFQGAGPDTVLDGGVALTGWEPDGSTWSVGGQTQQGEVHGACRPEAPRCDRPEELFLDGERLEHVGSLDQVGAGSWFFDYDADRIHVGTDPTDHTVTTSVTPFAIKGEAAGVTVRDLTVVHYATIAQRGAVQADGPDWLIEGVTADDNHALGVYFSGDRTVVRDVTARGNGQMGMGGSGSTGPLVEGVELAGNNAIGFDDEWEGGGAKFTDTVDMTFRDSYVHDNDGTGIWFDESAKGSTIEGNRSIDNLGAGIFYEISLEGTIVDNVVTGNGFGEEPLGWVWGSGIQVAASRAVRVEGNEVTGNRNAIVVIQQDRGGGRYGDHVADDIEITGNTIDPADGVTGAATDVEGADLFDRDITFEGNDYRVGAGQLAFTWDGDDLDVDAWTALGFS